MPIEGPSLGRLLAAAALIGGVPVLAIGLLLLFGQVTLAPGLLALAAVGSAALLLARVWLGNLRRLAEAMRRAEAGEAELTDIGPRLLPSIAEIAEAVRRLSRGLRERAELVVRLRQADEAIVESLPDPLVVLDRNGAPLRANAAARALFGTAPPGPLPSHRVQAAPRPAPGGSAGDLAALLRHPALADALDAAAAESAPQRVELSLPVPVPRDLSVHVLPMEPELADGGRLVLVLADRTRDRALERMRADFVANASHELRTPLASLIGFVETLRGPARDDPEARGRFLDIMADQADRMRRLIDDLLGLSRVEVAEHLPPTGRVDLAALAQAEAAAMAPLLEARGARLECSLADGAFAEPADGEQIGQVLRNLLENAARYGREGGAIRLSVARVEPGGRWPARPGVVLAVADEGPGIARHHIPRLTERFYRVDRGRSRSAGGTGLGLAIVKHIVNRHRGQLVIDSEEGLGSTFQVWLPGGV
jgi:two-component system phosphate regulon sensor histidine kinase PhoR